MYSSKYYFALPIANKRWCQDIEDEEISKSLKILTLFVKSNIVEFDIGDFVRKSLSKSNH